jgi:hypothetical protein
VEQPDDLTHIGSDLFVSFQNGVPSTGGTTGTPTHSTIVKFTSAGRIEQTWQLTGKCDGLPDLRRGIGAEHVRPSPL